MFFKTLSVFRYKSTTQLTTNLQGSYREVIGNFTDASPIDGPFRVGCTAMCKSTYLLIKKDLKTKLLQRRKVVQSDIMLEKIEIMLLVVETTVK